VTLKAGAAANVRNTACLTPKLPPECAGVRSRRRLPETPRAIAMTGYMANGALEIGDDLIGLFAGRILGDHDKAFDGVAELRG
jgi:hypothetical protein